MSIHDQARRLVVAAKRVPIVRVGEPGTDEWLTCIGCGANQSVACVPDCWSYKLECAVADMEAALAEGA